MKIKKKLICRMPYDHEEGLLVDYYSKTGRRYDITYDDGEQILGRVVSMRIIDVDRSRN